MKKMIMRMIIIMKKKYKNYEKEKNKFNIVIMEDSNVAKISFIEKISFLGNGKLILSNKKKLFFMK